MSLLRISSSSCLQRRHPLAFLCKIVAVVSCFAFYFSVIESASPDTCTQADLSTNTACGSGTFVKIGDISSCCTTAGSCSCQQCPDGTYSDPTVGIVILACTPCPGRKIPNTGQSSCTSCAAGQIKDSTGKQCVQCPIGYSNDINDNDDICRPCRAGTFADSANICQPCPAGQYNYISGATLCSDCPKGFFSGSGQSYCAPCPKGKIAASIKSTECVSCADNNYTDDGIQCIPCAAGFYSKSGWPECVKCPAGEISTSGNSCTPVSAGSYQPILGGTSPIACPAGFKCDTAGMASPKPCNAGEASSESSSSCSPCAAGSFSDVGSSACAACPAGTVSNKGTSTGGTACYPCPAGQVASGGTVCVPCSAGTFADAEKSVTCKACDDGSYSEVGAATCTPCPKGQVSNDPKSGCANVPAGYYTNPLKTPCPDGTYAPATGLAACRPCKPGTYAVANVSTGTIVCSQCIAGKFQSNWGASSCSDCAAGFYSAAGATVCTACAIGKRSGPASSACELCDVNSVATSTGVSICTVCPSHTVDVARMRCEPCDAGWYRDATVTFCTRCPSGTYGSTVGGGCIQCAAGTYSDSPGSTFCKPALPGMDTSGKAGETSKSFCVAGTYNPGVGISSCLDCAAGSFSSVSTDTTPTVACTLCPPGEFSEAKKSSCSVCPSGTYFDKTASANSCPACRSGFHTAQTGQKFCLPCPVGTHLPSTATDHTTCTNCLAGTYQDSIGASECKNCPDGTFAPRDGMEICFPCPAGTMSDGGRSCKLCDKGFYQDSLGQIGCKKCPDGYVSKRDGSVVCDPCPIGTYSTDGKICSACSKGMFNSKVGQSACLPCPAGSYSNTVGSVQCKFCSEGTYQDIQGQTECLTCAAGFYSPDIGRSTSCLECPESTYSFENVVTCTPCSAGSASSRASSRCELCAGGTYAPRNGMVSCLPCPAGSATSGTGSTFCSKCNPGKYQDQPGKATCLDCPPGQHSDKVGSRTCTVCSRGSAAIGPGNVVCTLCKDGMSPNKDSGADLCISCPKGKYKNQSTGSSLACSDCPLGTSNNSEGQTVCAHCAPGTYSDTLGLIDCKPCPLGTFSDVFGASECSVCPSGTFGSSQQLLSCSKCPNSGFQPKTGQKACEQCPRGSARRADVANSIINCFCDTSNFLSVTGDPAVSTTATCTPCPVGAVCDGSNILKPQAGYWRMPSKGLSHSVFVACPNSACYTSKNSSTIVTYGDSSLLELDELCKAGYKGILCSSCDSNKGYFRFGTYGCLQCPSMNIRVLQGVSLLLICLFVVNLIVSFAIRGFDNLITMPTVGAKILIANLQLTAIAFSFDVAWPSSLVAALQLKFAGNEGGIENLVSWQCLFAWAPTSSAYILKLGVYLLLPLFVVFVSSTGIFIYYVLRDKLVRVWHSAKRKKHYRQLWRQVLWTVFGVVMYLLYPVVTVVISQGFVCRKVDDRYYLDQDMNYECYSTSHILVICFMLVPAIILFVIGLPAFVFNRLYNNRFRLYSSSNIMKKFSFFYRGYKFRYYWWDIVLLFRRTVCSVAMVQLALGSTLVNMVTVEGFLAMFGFVQFLVFPFEQDLYNHLEAYSLVASSLTLLVCLFFLTKNLSDTLQSIVVIFLLVLNGLFYVAWLVYLIRDGLGISIPRSVTKVELENYVSKNVVNEYGEYDPDLITPKLITNTIEAKSSIRALARAAVTSALRRGNAMGVLSAFPGKLPSSLRLSSSRLPPIAIRHLSHYVETTTTHTHNHVEGDGISEASSCDLDLNEIQAAGQVLDGTTVISKGAGLDQLSNWQRRALKAESVTDDDHSTISSCEDDKSNDNDYDYDYINAENYFKSTSDGKIANVQSQRDPERGSSGSRAKGETEETEEWNEDLWTVSRAAERREGHDRDNNVLPLAAPVDVDIYDCHVDDLIPPEERRA